MCQIRGIVYSVVNMLYNCVTRNVSTVGFKHEQTIKYDPNLPQVLDFQMVNFEGLYSKAMVIFDRCIALIGMHKCGKEESDILKTLK